MNRERLLLFIEMQLEAMPLKFDGFFLSLLVPVVHNEIVVLIAIFLFSFSFFVVEVGEINASKIGWTNSEDPLLAVKHGCVTAGSGNIT